MTCKYVNKAIERKLTTMSALALCLAIGGNVLADTKVQADVSVNSSANAAQEWNSEAGSETRANGNAEARSNVRAESDGTEAEANGEAAGNASASASQSTAANTRTNEQGNDGDDAEERRSSSPEPRDNNTRSSARNEGIVAGTAKAVVTAGSNARGATASAVDSVSVPELSAPAVDTSAVADVASNATATLNAAMERGAAEPDTGDAEEIEQPSLPQKDLAGSVAIAAKTANRATAMLQSQAGNPADDAELPS
ncbi:MAG: hypothetical protein WBM54_10995, partial [Woeseia sp.]